MIQLCGHFERKLLIVLARARQYLELERCIQLSLNILQSHSTNIVCW